MKIYTFITGEASMYNQFEHTVLADEATPSTTVIAAFEESNPNTPYKLVNIDRLVNVGYQIKETFIGGKQ